MMRQVNRLTDFIKPAAPSQETRIKVQNNTTHWMTTNMNILHEHYEHTILTLSNLTYNSTALQIATGWARKRYNTRLRIETLLTAEQIIHTHSNTSTNITSNTASTSQATIAYTKPLPISRTRQRIGDSLSPIPELSDEEEFPPLPAPRKTTVLSLGQRTTLSEHITNYNKQQQTRTPLLPTPTQPQRPDQTPPSAHRLPVYKIPPRTQTRTGPIIPRPQPPGQTQLPPLAQLPPNPHFTSPITMETRQTPPGPQTSTPQTTRQLKMTDSTNHRRPELSPIKNTTTTTTSATTVTSPPNNRKILTQAQIHRPPDQLNTTPDLHSISLTTHSNSNVSILISELISPLCPSPAGGADSGAGATPQWAPPEQKEEGNNMMKGNCKAKHIGTKSHSEPSSQLSSGAPAVSRADPDLSPPTNREVNTTDPQLASPPRQRTLTPILPDPATDLKRKGNNCKDPPGQNITHPQAEQIIHTHSNTSTNITSNTASTSQATIAYTKPLPISRTRQRIGDSLSPIPELSDEEEFPPLPAPRKTTVLSLGQRTTLSEHITNYNKQQQTRTPLLPTPTQPQRPDQTPPSAHRLPVYKIPPRTQTRTGPIIPRPQPPGQTQLPPLAQLPPNPHFTSPITMETRQTPPGPQTSTPQTTRQLKMTDSTNHRRPELSPIKNTTTTTTSATTVTSPPNNRKILTQAQIHRPPDQLNTTPDLHSISLTTHSNSNVSILISELISPLCPSPAGGADSGAGATPQWAPPEQKEEGNNMMKGNCKAKHIGTKSHSEPSSQLSSGAPAVSRADPDLSPPTNREVNTTDPQLASPPRQRTLTPILPDPATDLKRKGNNCKDPPGQNITHPQAEQIIHTHSNTSTNITSNTASTSQATIAYTKPLPISRTRQRIGDSLSPIPELSDEEEFPPLPAPRKTTVLSLGQRTTLSEHITNYNKQQQTRTPLLPTPTQPQRPDQTPPSAHRLPVYKIPPRTQTRTGPIIPRPQPPGQTQLPPLAQLPPNPHFTSPITMETRQTPPGPQTSTPQTTRQLKMTDSTNHRRPELSPIKNTTTTTTSATTVTSPPNNRKILTQAQIHRPPDQLNTTPDLHSISLTTHSNSNVSILISELISPLCPSPAGGADSGAGATPQWAPPEQKEEGNNMMKGNCKAKHIGTKSHSEPSSQLSSGAPAVSRADPDLSPPTNREVNTTDPQLASPPRQRTLTPILPGDPKSLLHFFLNGIRDCLNELNNFKTGRKDTQARIAFLPSLTPSRPCYGPEKEKETAAKTHPDRTPHIPKAIHHKHIINHAISSGTFPPGMMRQVNRLTDFIKPAAPSQETRIKVQNNTTHWMTTNMNILHEHYEHTILTLSNLTYNSTALQIATGWARKRYNTRLRIETLQTAEQIIHTHSNTSTNITSNTASTSQATIAYTKPLPISRTRQRIGDSLSPIPELSDEEEFPPLPAPRKTTVLSLGQRTTLSEHITNYNKQQQTRTPLLPTPTQPQRPDQTPPSAHRLPVYKIPPRTQTRTGPIIPRPQPPGQTQLPSLAQLPPNPHFTSPITMETRQTPPGPQTSTPQTTRQPKMTDNTNHRQPELSPIRNTTTTTTSATTVTSPPNNRKILTQAQIHRPPDQLNTTPDLHSISLTTHSNSNVSILISELISPLCPSPAGGADSGAGATPQRAPPEQKEEGNNVMKGNCKAKHIGIKSHSEPSSQLSSGAPAVSRADPVLSPPTNREVNTTDPQLASPPRQRTLTPILPGKFKPAHHITRPSRKLQDWSFKGRKPVLASHHHWCLSPSARDLNPDLPHGGEELFHLRQASA
ncbi:hypothetical protein PAMA_011146 [Pampus argenteus]